MRVAAVYALLDMSGVIRADHLTAALAFWSYSEASVRFIFRDSLGDPVAEQVLAALREQPGGLTRTAIRDLLGRHAAVNDVDGALNLLAGSGLARREKQATNGRPVERWFAIVGAARSKSPNDRAT